MADDDTESLIESTELSKVVGLHWHQVKYRINISNRGDNYSPNAEKIKMRLFSKGKKIQLARVFVRVL